MNQNENLPATAKEKPALNAESGLSISAGKELQIASSAAGVMQEIQGAILLSKQFPRNINQVFVNAMKSCERKSMAKIAEYSFPRGSTNVRGPSVHIARMLAGVYCNLRYGLDIIRDDENTRLIRGWAWDIETNLKVSFDDDFKKLIYRKKGGWITPDERDLRELTNRRGAMLVRNAILSILPRDLTEDALLKCKKTLKSSIDDPELERKSLIMEMDKYGVTVKMVDSYLGTTKWGADDLVQIRGIINSLQDGNSERDDYFGTPKEQATTGSLNVGAASAGDASTHQGHEPLDKETGEIKDSEGELPLGEKK